MSTDDLSESRRVRQLFHTLFTAYPGHIALLDMEGSILAVNDAWTQFGHDNGLDPAYRFEKVSYLGVCERAITQRDEYARQALTGLLAVLATGRPEFTLVYPCHSPSERRWFRLRATLLVPEIHGALVSHTLLDASEKIPSHHLRSTRPASSKLEYDAITEVLPDVSSNNRPRFR